MSPTSTLHEASTASSDHTLRRYPWRRSVTPWTRIVEQSYEGQGTAEKPYLINWLDDDAENPLALGEAYKWAITCFVSVATLAVALSSSAYAGATTAVARDFGGSREVLTLPVSLFVLGFAIGPCVFAPLSE